MGITDVPKKNFPFPNYRKQDFKRSNNDRSYHSIKPKNTSTSMNFRSYPLCNSKTKYEEPIIHKDFKIYEEFDEYDFLSDCSSGSNYGDLSRIQIYEDFDQVNEEPKTQDESIFENVFFSDQSRERWERSQ